MQCSCGMMHDPAGCQYHHAMVSQANPYSYQLPQNPALEMAELQVRQQQLLQQQQHLQRLALQQHQQKQQMLQQPSPPFPDTASTSLRAQATPFVPSSESRRDLQEAKKLSGELYVPPSHSHSTSTSTSDSIPLVEAQRALVGKVFSGVVQSYDAERGTGFILSTPVYEAFRLHCMLHCSKCQGVDPRPGMMVSFTLQVNQQGKPKATNVHALPPSPTPSATGTIKSFSPKMGYGFVESPAILAKYGKDVYFKRLSNGAAPVPGMPVAFTLVEEENGNLKAQSLVVHPIDCQPTGPPASYEPTSPLMACSEDATRYCGTIKSYNPTKGYGFIECPELHAQYSRDVFFFKPPPELNTDPGSVVYFSVHLENGNIQARNMTAADDRSMLQDSDIDRVVLPSVPRPPAADSVAPPLPGQNPWELDVIFFHATCWDGLCSAYALWNAAGSRRDEIDLIPVSSGDDYNDKEHPAIRGRNIALVDVAFQTSTLELFREQCRTFVVIDHHKSNHEGLLAIPPEFIRFHLGLSAVGIAWEFSRLALAAHPDPEKFAEELLEPVGIAPPLFLHLVGEVDLGRFGIEHPTSRRFAMGVEIFAHHPAFADEERTLTLPKAGKPSPGILWRLAQTLRQGDRFIKKLVHLGGSIEGIVENTIREWMSGVQIRRFKKSPEKAVAMVKLPSQFPAQFPVNPFPFRFARNELGHRLARVPGVVCGVVVAGKSVMLRCDPEQGDVSELAGILGGGGHSTAAAFQLDDLTDVEDVLM